MAHTIFILGTDAEQCKALRELLQDRVTDTIVTSAGENLPSVQKSDTIIITSEEKNTGVLYRRLLNKLEDQVRRAQFLGEMVRLFSSSHQPNEIVEKVAAKSTEVLGETAFVVLVNDANQLRVDAAYSKNPESLVKMLMTAVNLAPQGLNTSVFGEVIEGRKPVLIPNLRELECPTEIRNLIDKFSLTSLIAAPIQS